MSLSIPYDLARAEGGALLVGCAVSPTFIPALEMVAHGLAERHPKASADQLLDMIFTFGIIAAASELKLPRPASNQDEDA